MIELKDISKQNNFKTPEGYFENFENKIAENIPVIKTRSEATTPFQIFKPYIYMAACILLLVGGLKLFWGIVVDKSNILYNDVSAETNDSEYFEEIYTEISEDDLVFYEFLSELNSDNNEPHFYDNEFIEEYLLQYNIEYELFNE